MSNKQLINKENWREQSYSFFSHRECEAFPCHMTDDEDHFNCLFCFCPLYPLGGDCGGIIAYTKNGVKDCSGCLMPHEKENYGRVVQGLAMTIYNTKG